MTSPITLAVHGASGRMGQSILRLALARSDLRVAAALVGENSGRLGAPLPATPGVDAATLNYASALPLEVDLDVLIDFSAPVAFDRALAMARTRGIAFISGTTGLSADQHARMADAATDIPVLWSANFSIGVAVLHRLVREAAHLLADWDCDILEAHHRHKKDAPSGTALALGRSAAQARGVDFDRHARLHRSGVADTSRDPAEIGFAVVRGGDIVGEHSVLFATDGERIELRHVATDRDIFARGALAAALALANASPGRHEFADLVAARQAR